MVNRVGLLQVIAPSVKLAARDGVAYQKALTTSLAILIRNYELSEAQRLKAAEKQELSTAIDQLFTLPELKKISKRWEPKRAVASGFTQTEIVRALQSLLNCSREPYARPTLKLDAARKLSGKDKAELLEQIQVLMPLAELRAVLRLWDKKLKIPKGWTVRQYKERLQALLRGSVEPEA